MHQLLFLLQRNTLMRRIRSNTSLIHKMCVLLNEQDEVRARLRSFAQNSGAKDIAHTHTNTHMEQASQQLNVLTIINNSPKIEVEIRNMFRLCSRLYNFKNDSFGYSAFVPQLEPNKGISADRQISNYIYSYVQIADFAVVLIAKEKESLLHTPHQATNKTITVLITPKQGISPSIALGMNFTNHNFSIHIYVAHFAFQVMDETKSNAHI